MIKSMRRNASPYARERQKQQKSSMIFASLQKNKNFKIQSFKIDQNV